MLNTNLFSAFRAFTKLAPVGLIHRDIEIQVEKDKLYPPSYQHRILPCCMWSSALPSPIFSILNDRIQPYMLQHQKKSLKYLYVIKPGRSRDMWYKALQQNHSFELDIRNFVLWLITNFYLSMLKRAVANRWCHNDSDYMYMPCVKCCSEVHTTRIPPRKGLWIHSIMLSSSLGESICPWRKKGKSFREVS